MRKKNPRRGDSADRIWLRHGLLDEPEVRAIVFHHGVACRFSLVHMDDGLSRMRCNEDPGWLEVFASRDSLMEYTTTPG